MAWLILTLFDRFFRTSKRNEEQQTVKVQDQCCGNLRSTTANSVWLANDWFSATGSKQVEFYSSISGFKEYYIWKQMKTVLLEVCLYFVYINTT